MVAIPIAMAVGSALLNRQATKSANKQTRIATANQMAFQREMSNTSYVRGMEDMRQAGLNPILAGKMGGASTPTGASYVAQKATPVESGVAGVNSYMQNKQLAQNIQINKHSTDFANSTGIPIEHANDVLKSGYSAKYIAKNFKKDNAKPIKKAKEKVKTKAQQALDKIQSYAIKKAMKKSGSKITYKGKKVYPDRILRPK
jgi:hypothetical protein